MPVMHPRFASAHLRRSETISMAADGGLESLIAGFYSGAVQGLFQRFAGEHAEGVRDTCLLLRLADAARDLVIDGLVVGGFAAQQHPG